MKRQLLAIVFEAIPIFCCAMAQAASTPLFIPQPREWHPSGTLPLTITRIVVPGRDPEDDLAGRNLETALRADGVQVTDKRVYAITLLREGTPGAADALRGVGLRFDPAMNDEGYVIIAEGAAPLSSLAARVACFMACKRLSR